MKTPQYGGNKSFVYKKKWFIALFQHPGAIILFRILFIISYILQGFNGINDMDWMCLLQVCGQYEHALGYLY